MRDILHRLVDGLRGYLMSNWTHSICPKCWDQKFPHRHPVMVNDAETETCCYCGTDTKAGIYVRADPKEMLCQHAVEEVADS